MKQTIGTPGGRVRKNMDMDARKLAQVRELFGVRTDTEAVDQALNMVLFQTRVLAGIDRLAAAGGVVDVYAQCEPRTVRKRSGVQKPHKR